MNLLPVIMAGGTGSRLWPLSRELYPKQFLPLAGDRTMVQETVGRLDGLDTLSPIVICNEEHRFIVAEQLRGIGAGRPKIVLEPAGRNTAPAIALAALQARDQGEDPFLLVLAADHIIANVTAFHESVAGAVKLAETGKLVTFGVVARTPETGYGYIQRGDTLKDGYAVTAFVEKPDQKTAESYVSSGDYYWNSGMFVFRASRYLEELTKFRPAIVEACEAALSGAENDLDFLRLNAEAFKRCPSESVDYAVMQNTSEAAVVPLDAGWNDIGSWSSLWEVSDQDEDGNALRGDVITSDTRNTLAFGDSRLVTLVGVEDLIVVETKDAVLVAHKDKVQNVKSIVDQMARQGRHEHIHHRNVYRPWGHYDSIDFGQRDQVKRITVSPGAKLSVQKHFHRSEHWVVVHGTAIVHKGDEVLTLSENESTYIPVGEIHALENPGKIPLEIIEVQTGSYLGEDDIVRFDDRYGRQ